MPLKVGVNFGAHTSTLENENAPDDIPDEKSGSTSIVDAHLECPVERSHDLQFPVSKGMQNSSVDNTSTYMSLDNIMHSLDDNTSHNETSHGEIPIDPLLFQLGFMTSTSDSEFGVFGCDS